MKQTYSSQKHKCSLTLVKIANLCHNSDMEHHSNKLSSFLHTSLVHKYGFTLAEVLITLGIIGVVAAMTMPTLINRTQNKQLETAFKKAYSVQSQALLYTKQSLGVENLNLSFADYDAANKVYPHKMEFQNEYYKQLKVAGQCKYDKPVRNYSNTADAYIDLGNHNPDRQLPDGSCCSVNINGMVINITVDINGAKKGPNRVGHDIFVFRVDSNDKLLPVKMSKKYTEDELKDIENNFNSEHSDVNSTVSQAGSPCSVDSSQKGNGLGCSWYAMNDINPDDETKGYWVSLP